MMKSPALSLSGLAALALVACADPNDLDLPRLEFNAGVPAELTAGDTTEALSVTKIFLDPRGREVRTNPYYDFHFVSSDTAVVKVVEGRRLLGVKAGEASVTAADELSKARTPSAKTVVVK